MTPRRIEASELDPELHPNRCYRGLTWVHRVGHTDYTFPVHSVARDKHGDLVITYGGRGADDPFAPRVVVGDHHEVLIDTIVEREATDEAEIELGR